MALLKVYGLKVIEGIRDRAERESVIEDSGSENH